MDSPIILLIFWFVINLVLKSAKDKKKIEEVRQKRMQQGNRPLQNNTSTTQRPAPKKNRSIIDVFKEEIEREVQREKEAHRRNEPVLKEIKSSPITTKVKEKTVKPLPVEADISIESDDSTVLHVIDTAGMIHKTKMNSPSLNLKKDILKGIIYSEILSEPKGLRNIKRSM